MFNTLHTLMKSSLINNSYILKSFVVQKKKKTFVTTLPNLQVLEYDINAKCFRDRHQAEGRFYIVLCP